MNRHVVAGMLGLALAGCSLDRSLASRSRSTLSAVELTPPLRTIHETINQENALVNTDTVRSGHPVAATDLRRKTWVASTAPKTVPPPPSPRDGEVASAGTGSGEETATTDKSETRLAETTDSRTGRARPSPFSRFLGKPRPRARTAAQPVATTPASGEGEAAATTALAVAASDHSAAQPAAPNFPRPEPDPEMTAPLAPDDPPQLKLETRPADAPTDPTAVAEAPASQDAPPAPPATPPASAPAEPAPETGVKVEVPGPGTADAPVEVPSGPATAEAASPPSGPLKPKAPGRDPILGTDPDVMPDLKGVVAAGAPKENPDKGPADATTAPLTAVEPAPTPAVEPAPTPAVEPAPAPAPAPASAPTPTTPVGEPPAKAENSPLPDAVETGVAPTETPPAAPVIQLSAPTDLESTPANAATPAPAAAPVALPEAAVAPAPARDPLLGPNPDVMPTIETPPALSTTSAPARSPSIPSDGGRPPSVPEMTGIAPPRASEPPVSVPSDPATTPAQAEIPATPTPIPPLSPDVPSAGDAPTPIPAFPAVSVDRPEGPQPDAAPAPPVIDREPKKSTAPSPSRDPLLGANPDIMPTFTMPPAKTPSPAPPVQPAPKPVPTPTPAPAPAPEPLPAVAPKPAEGVSDPVELPPLSNPEASSAVPERSSGGFASMPVSAPEGEGEAKTVRPPMRMPDEAAVRSKAAPRSVFAAGKPAAWVGEEVITLHELTVVFKQRRKGMPAGQQLSDEMRYYMAKSVLNDMVDRALVLQEAKRELKDAKKFQKFMEVADGQFYEEEVPPLLRQTSSPNVHELKKKMAEQGESLDEIREQYRLEFLSRGYMEQKLGPKMKVDLHEMRDYYKAHLNDFDLPAQVTWREVLVEVDKYKSRAEARARADALLAKLRGGADFAVLAKAESDGPNKSDGGLWKTSPGSYGVPAVNSALETLPTGQVSPVIEGPTSYHIVVVENRRAAGPATFAEVQDKCRNTIRRKKINRETAAYMEKLRSRTVVRTVFDDPGVTRTSAEFITPQSTSARR